MHSSPMIDETSIVRPCGCPGPAKARHRQGCEEGKRRRSGTPRARRAERGLVGKELQFTREDLDAWEKDGAAGEEIFRTGLAFRAVARGEADVIETIADMLKELNR